MIAAWQANLFFAGQPSSYCNLGRQNIINQLLNKRWAQTSLCLLYKVRKNEPCNIVDIRGPYLPLLTGNGRTNEIYTKRQRGAVCKYKFRKSSIRKLRTYKLFFDLRTFRKCGNLRTMYFLRFAYPIIFANPQIHKFSPYKNKLKMLSFKFKDDFWLLEQFWDDLTGIS